MNMSELSKGLVMVFAIGATGNLPAADYSTLSAEELLQARTQNRDLSAEDRGTFRTEMQSRVQAMSTEEKALFQDMNRANRPSDGSGQMQREGQRGSGGYGQGYASRQGSIGSGGGRGVGRGHH